MAIPLDNSRQTSDPYLAEIDFANILNTLQEVFYVFDVKNQLFLYVNQAYEYVWGRSKADLLQEANSFWEGIHPDDRPLVQKGIQQSAQQAGMIQLEYRVIRPDGSVRWVSDITYSTPDESGQVHRKTGIVLDITKKKLLENSLRQLATRIHALHEVSATLLSSHSIEHIASVTLDHLQQLIPNNHITIYQYQAEEQLATILAAAVPPNSGFIIKQQLPCEWVIKKPSQNNNLLHYINELPPLAVCQGLQLALRSEGVVSLIFALFIWQGEVIGALQIGAPEANGFRREHLEIVREIAELLTAAFHKGLLGEKLRQYADNLEGEVAKRTEDLQQAYLELQQANQFKDEFLATMSHELRTPLTSVLTKSELFQEGIYGELTQQQKRELHAIEASGKHLLTLLNDILEFAQFETGQLDLIWEPVSVRAVCEESLQVIREMARQKGVRLVAPEIDQFVLMDGDKQRLKKILVSLLANAIKFTPVDGEAGLRVALLPPADAIVGEEQVQFTVWDTGIGIAPEKVSQIFTPFKQLDGGLARQYEGLGLGLALCQRLVHLLGGDCQVESQPGVGSQFIVTIPRQQLAAPAAFNEKLIQSGRQVAGHRRQRPLHILLVAPEAGGLPLYQAYADEPAVHITMTETLATAVYLATGDQVDLIVLSESIPKAQLILLIQKISGLKLPLFVFSEQVTAENGRFFRQAGITDYVSGPQLLAKVEHFRQAYKTRRHTATIVEGSHDAKK